MDRLPVSYGGTAASSAGQDVVDAKFDIGFRPTARRYERVQLLISTDDRAGHRFGWSLQPGPRLVQRPPQQQQAVTVDQTTGTGAN